MGGRSSGGLHNEMRRFADAFRIKRLKGEVFLNTVNNLLHSATPGAGVAA
jgi:hypothetical protein